MPTGLLLEWIECRGNLKFKIYIPIWFLISILCTYLGTCFISRTVFSCVTGSCQLLVCSRDSGRWMCVANLSNLWNAFWRSQGLRILADDLHEFLNLSDNGQSDENHCAGLSMAPLECQSITEFFSSIAESSFMVSTWSRKLRRSGQRVTHNNCLLTALHKSGTISFWDVAIPVVDE